MDVVDTATNTFPYIETLKSAGTNAVGRYYSTQLHKVITEREADAIHAAGMSIFVVWEDGASDADFDADKGTFAAQHALICAGNINQDLGSAIYFAVDYDVAESALRSRVIPYFQSVKKVFAGQNGTYRIGVYGSGLACRLLLDSQLVDLAWLSQSTGHREHAAFLASRRWVLAQQATSTIGTLSVDRNLVNGDFGCFPVPPGAAVPASPIAAAVLAAPAAAPPVPVLPTPPTGPSFAQRVVDIATKEWTAFGLQTFDLNGYVTHGGHKEGENGYYQRVGTYWIEGTATHGVDGRNHDHAWSAAFISYVMKMAGAGDQFRYSTLHSVYIYQAIRDRLSQRVAAGFWAYRLNEYKPNLGDLICWARQADIDYDDQAAGFYKGHADIIVDVGTAQIEVIGGNVGDSVTRRPFALDANGYLKSSNEGGESLFAIMQNRIT